MGHEEGSGPDRRADNGESQDRGVAGAELEKRIARLEQELAALQQRMNSFDVEYPEAQSFPVTFAAPAQSTPPPPPPSPIAATGDTGASRKAAEQWMLGAHPKASAMRSSESFEDRLGSQIFNRIGIVLLLLATAYGLKMAVDHGLIGPTTRVLIGLAAGAGLVVWSERFRSKGFAAFSYSLKALGSGVLYLSLWAAFQLFHLLSAPVALGMMVLVTAWNAYMAWSQNSELLAVYALAGGFATPLLVSTGGNHEVFLFTYLLAIDIATVILVRLKVWPRLLLGAFPVTVMFFIGWYVEFFSAAELVVTSIYAVLFGAVFASVAWGEAKVERALLPGRSRQTILIGILLPIANAAFIASAMYSVLEDSGHHALLPWLMIALAVSYLGLMTMPQQRTASAIHLSLAVVFLTIAIPLKASGHWITVSWLVEGLALLWVASRLEQAHTEDGSADDSLASSTLRWLGLGSLLLGFCGVCFHGVDQLGVTVLPLVNKATGTALAGVGVFSAAAWLAMRAAPLRAQTGRALGWRTVAFISFLLIPVTALLLTARELISFAITGPAHPPFHSSDFLTALLGLLILAAVVAVSLRVAKIDPDPEYWNNCAALCTIAFNLVAVLTGVREVSAIWSNNSATWSEDAGLRQALAISAFLMTYGAALLAAGFWRRNAFLRWQALVLLVFTIFKTFLYDMRNLSQGYRVVSLLGLGVLLMAISFAYQKNWLGLRESAPGGDAQAAHEATE